MQQRKYATGRPTGTDGSDFSYRMVVESRYTAVAKGKSRLHALIIIQAVVQLAGLLCAFLLKLKEDGPDFLAISSVAVSSISLFIGELGQRRSRVNLLRVCVVALTIAIVLSMSYALRSTSILQLIQKPTEWARKEKFELQIALVLFGSLVQILMISTIISLIGNMSPPKRAS